MNEFLAFLAGLVAAVLPGFGEPAAPSWNGYVEADYVYVAAAAPGQIDAVPVTEGDRVAAGQVLVVLDRRQHSALAAAAEARVAAAAANLENLATGSRVDEIEVIRASLQKAEADRTLAEENAGRSRQLFTEGLAPQARLDRDLATLASAEAAVRQLEAQLKVAELPARDAQQVQAEANLAAARADADRARADLDDRAIAAPVAARVERLFFGPGETAGAGVPLASLLPDGALKVKFYVPGPQRPLLAEGMAVALGCEGCPAGIEAVITHFASDPQFTPPVIYSREERDRLSFLAEATLVPGAVLPPGQPVTVSLAGDRAR